MNADLPAERRARHYAAIDSAGRAMRRLMDDLLDATSLEQGKLSLTSGAQPVEALLAEAQRRFEPQAREKEIELSWSVSDDLPLVWGDGERLLQVLANLVGNALKFTLRGGRVTLSAHLEEGVVFTVSDTGEGIESADLPRLFDRFYRGRNQAIQGVGLGLSICSGPRCRWWRRLQGATAVSRGGGAVEGGNQDGLDALTPRLVRSTLRSRSLVRDMHDRRQGNGGAMKRLMIGRRDHREESAVAQLPHAAPVHVPRSRAFRPIDGRGLVRRQPTRRRIDVLFLESFVRGCGRSSMDALRDDYP